MNKMNTINQTAKLCKEYNLGISRNMLRKLAHSGEIPCIRCGQSILINWDKLLQYLDTNTLNENSGTAPEQAITADIVEEPEEEIIIPKQKIRKIKE